MHLTASAVRPRKSRIILRSVIIVLALLLIAFVAFDVWFYRGVRASLPVRDGTVALAGLSAPVIVTYDNLGVPNISAANVADLFFAQGYVTAQDRLWQMDMTRRFASGRLAEILGPEYLKYDRENRILGLRQVAERSAAAMGERELAHFQAYAAGVNAYIEQHRNALPMEFRFLRYSPQPWTIADSMLVRLSMTEFLNHGLYEDKLEKEKILAKLGPELTGDLFVNTSWRDHPPGTEANSIDNAEPGEGSGEEEEQGSTLPGANGPLLPPPSFTPMADWQTALRPGSNNWVLSGAHTTTGKPMLSNDMHLQLEIPNVWYEAHLTAGDFDVAGVTLPGVPYVVAGHNRRIAWGFTNLGPNVEDLYVEKFNEAGEYLTPQGWQAPEHRKEIIAVKGRGDVTLDVVTTRHGPIISDLIEGEQRRLALKWTIYDPKSWAVPFFAVNSASNWQDFEAAFAKFGAPAQNVVYADVDGHIGYQATGLIPIRASGNGDVPEPGEDDAHEWTGFVPYDQLPRVYDPPSGIIATANGRITPDNYPYQLSIEWMGPYRTQRIYKLLTAPKKFSAPDMLAIQTDITSTFDLYCAQRLVYAVDHASKASARARTAADILRKWDGAMEADSVAATIAVFSRRALEEKLLKPKLGDQWRDYKWFMRPVWLEGVLTHQPPRWLPAEYGSYDDLLTAAVEAAVSDPSAPTSLALWKWGRVNRVEIEHPFWSHFPVLKRAAGTGSQSLSGDGQTVKQVGPRFGPSERMTVDFSDLDNTKLNIVNGQSGNIFDDHYNDQWEAYYHGRTFTMPFSERAVRDAAAHHLRLQPQ